MPATVMAHFLYLVFAVFKSYIKGGATFQFAIALNMAIHQLHIFAHNM